MAMGQSKAEEMGAVDYWNGGLWNQPEDQWLRFCYNSSFESAMMEHYLSPPANIPPLKERGLGDEECRNSKMPGDG